LLTSLKKNWTEAGKQVVGNLKKRASSARTDAHTEYAEKAAFSAAVGPGDHDVDPGANLEGEISGTGQSVRDLRREKNPKR